MKQVGYDEPGDDLRPRHSYRRYTREYLDNLFAAADIVEVIGQHVDLRAIGRDEWKGLCPFHDDHRPSLNVNQAKGVFLCRSCQASGNVVSFLMMLEGLSFPETIRRLQQITGISPPSSADMALSTWDPKGLDGMEAAEGPEDVGKSMEDLMWMIADIGGSVIKRCPEDRSIRSQMMAVFQLADEALARDDIRTLDGIYHRLPALTKRLGLEAST